MTYPTREAWLDAAVNALRPMFKDLGYPIPAKVRVSCSFPSRRAVSKKSPRVGECWDPKASTTGHNEMFISPVMDDVGDVIGTLAHELVHTAVGVKEGHKGKFRKAALAIGLEGKMTHTTEGPEFIARIKPILKALGKYPHGRIRPEFSMVKKQTTRLIKLECRNTECGYVLRTTQKWLDVGLPTCCCGDEFSEDGAGEGGED